MPSSAPWIYLEASKRTQPDLQKQRNPRELGARGQRSRLTNPRGSGERLRERIRVTEEEVAFREAEAERRVWGQAACIVCGEEEARCV